MMRINQEHEKTKRRKKPAGEKKNVTVFSFILLLSSYIHPNGYRRGGKEGRWSRRAESETQE